MSQASSRTLRSRTDSANSTDAGERVLTLSTHADRHVLRSELLKLILTSEQRRKGGHPNGHAQAVEANQETNTTDGSAGTSTDTAEA